MPTLLDSEESSRSPVTSWEQLSSQLDSLLHSHQNLCDDISQMKVVQSGIAVVVEKIQDEVSSHHGMSRISFAPTLRKIEESILALCRKSPHTLTKEHDHNEGPLTLTKEKDENEGDRLDRDSTSKFSRMSTKEQSHMIFGQSVQNMVDSDLSYCIDKGLVYESNTFCHVRGHMLLDHNGASGIIRRGASALNRVTHLSTVLCDCGQNRLLERICEHPLFGMFVFTAITVNACFMAYETDVAMSLRLQGSEPETGMFPIVESIFCILFGLELIMKIAAYRCKFFTARGWKWNVFDLAVFATALNDQIRSLLVSNSQGSNLAFLRILRALKVVRMLRIVRVLRFFHELRMIANNMVESVRTMAWTLLLIGIVTFVFGLTFLQAWDDFLQTHYHDIDPELKNNIAIMWSGTRRAMLSLYMAATGGDDWSTLAEPLKHLGVSYYCLFLLYVSFFMFVVTNVVTSLFVDQGARASKKDQHDIAAEHIRKKQGYVNMIRAVFNKMSKDPKGCVSAEEFSNHMSDISMVAFCAELNVEPSDLDQFFRALSGNGAHTVDLETFVMGCIKLRGDAKSADLMEVLITLRQAYKDQQAFRVCCERNFQQIYRELRSSMAYKVAYEKRFEEFHNEPHSLASSARSL